MERPEKSMDSNGQDDAPYYPAGQNIDHKAALTHLYDEGEDDGEDIEKYNSDSSQDYTYSDDDSGEDEGEWEGNNAAAVDEDYFPPIVTIFYSIFHPTKGPTVIYQVPEGCIYSSSSQESKETSGQQNSTAPTNSTNADDADLQQNATTQDEQSVLGAEKPKKKGQVPNAHTPLFDFKDLSEYIVPRAPLCGRLITYSTTSQKSGESYKILSHPVLIVDQQKYPRNSFIFNLAFVFDGRADVRAYEPIVRKCARELRDMEKGFSFLSRSQFRMYEVIEQLFEDLNSYYESFVALPDAPHSKYVSEAAKVAELLRDKRILVPRVWMDQQQTQSSTKGSASNSFSSDQRPIIADNQSHRGSFASSEAGSRHDSSRVYQSFKLTPISVETYGGETADSSEPSSDSPTQKVSRPPVRRVSTEMSVTLSPLSSSVNEHGDQEDNTTTNTTSKARKNSSASNGSSSGRPTTGRAKSFAALGLSSTTVSSTNSPSGVLAASITADRSNRTSSAGSHGEAKPMEGSNGYPSRTSTASNAVHIRKLSSESGNDLLAMSSMDEIEKERELSASISGLRTLDVRGKQEKIISADDLTTGSQKGKIDRTTIGEIAPAAMLAPGKREPPHGLGRRVRDAINVKLFPTYTNPKEVNDWDVPVTLLDLRRRISDNWDLTMRKVLPFIDGINHVKRIAQLADADLELTRQCIEHLLYYRCIILIDTFQFTNMYTVKPTIATLAEDEIVQNECAIYVTKSGFVLPSWPKLLSLYSSLRPSLTLNEWIEENDIDSIGIDVRRFVTFGVIKGFLRRVHRYPVLLLGEAGLQMDRLNNIGLGLGNNRDSSISPNMSSIQQTALVQQIGADRNATIRESSGSRERRRVEQLRQDPSAGPLSPEILNLQRTESPFQQKDRREASWATDDQAWMNIFTPARENSASRSDMLKGNGRVSGGNKRSILQKQTGAAGIHHHHQRTTPATVFDVANIVLDTANKERREQNQQQYLGAISQTNTITPSSSRLAVRSPLPRGLSSSTIRPSSNTGSGTGTLTRDNTFDDENRKGGLLGGNVSAFQKIPPGMIEMLDGSYPDDAFCVRFNRSWNEILHFFIIIGIQLPFQQQQYQQQQQQDQQQQQQTQQNTSGSGSSTPHATLSSRRGRQTGRMESNDGETVLDGTGGDITPGGGQQAPDESGFVGQMSGIWGIGGSTVGAAISTSTSNVIGSTPAAQSNKRMGSIGGLGPTTTITAFPSLPRYRKTSQAGSVAGQSASAVAAAQQSGFSRYTGASGDQNSSLGGGWNSIGKLSSGFGVAGLLPEELGYEERKRILRGDLGRVQIIVK